MYSAENYSITEIETMGFIYRGASLLPSELAMLAKVKTQSMSQILNKMEKHRVIIKTPSIKDKRKTHISLTDLGKEMVEKTRYERDKWLANAIERELSDKEKKILAESISILKKLTEAE